MIEALIFDFDGLILETEMPIFTSWQELYREHGFDFPFEKWALNLGTSEEPFDPVAELTCLIGNGKDLGPDLARRRARELELVYSQPPLPGVADYLEEAQGLGLKLGVASSSSRAWVEGHIERLGLRHYFSCVRTSDDVRYTKPDPTLYRLALECLDVPPRSAIALEDSRNGVIAAKDAGMYVVVIPNELTRRTDTGLADLALDSLTDLPLASLIDKIEAISSRQIDAGGGPRPN